MTAILTTSLPLPLHSRGKVRDTYRLSDRELLMVSTDRLSAFDVVLPTPIPEKGRVLNQLSLAWFEESAGLVRNHLTPDKEGYYTVHLPDGEQTTIYEASMRYQQEGVPLLVIAGKEYGSGSSRDWAAKGPLLLGVRAVIAESFERIHRSNLVGMGILPLQFKPGENKESLGLTGKEVYDIDGIEESLKPRQEVTVKVTREDGSTFSFQTLARLDSPIDVTYYENGGILPTVLRRLMKA